MRNLILIIITIINYFHIRYRSYYNSAICFFTMLHCYTDFFNSNQNFKKGSADFINFRQNLTKFFANIVKYMYLKRNRTQQPNHYYFEKNSLLHTLKCEIIIYFLKMIYRN